MLLKLESVWLRYVRLFFGAEGRTMTLGSYLSLGVKEFVRPPLPRRIKTMNSRVQRR